MTDFYIKKGDTLPKLALVLKDAADDPIDVSTADSVTFRMRKVNSGQPAGVYKVNAEMDLTTDGTDGAVELAFTALQTDDPGIYKGEVLIDWGGGDVQTIPNDSFINVNVLSGAGDV